MDFAFIDEKTVSQYLSPETCIKLMEQTLREECEGTCIQYLRTAIPLPNTNVLGLMPGWFGSYFGVKTISVYHTNRGSGYPSHQGQILLFSEDHGQLLACVDAASVTRIRTGAVSAAASKALARADSSHLAVLGCGVQGESHIRAITCSFPIRKLCLWDKFPEAAASLKERISAEFAGIEIQVCETVEKAAADADIICTVTPSVTPVLFADQVKKGAHINAVGACAPHARELDSQLVTKALFFCDHTESVFHESGDFLYPFHEGLIDKNHIKGTLGQVLAGKTAGRTDEDQITVFEALGMAVEDIAAAKYLYDQRRKEHK